MRASSFRVACVIMVTAAAWCAPANAVDSSAAQQLEQLQRRMQALELRVRQLEQAGSRVSGGAAPRTPASAKPDGTKIYAVDPALRSLAKLKEAWQHIERGMSDAQVRAELGEPSRLLTIDGKTVWYFSYEGVGGGSVKFSSAQRVVDWQNPPFGFW